MKNYLVKEVIGPSSHTGVCSGWYDLQKALNGGYTIERVDTIPSQQGIFGTPAALIYILSNSNE